VRESLNWVIRRRLLLHAEVILPRKPELFSQFRFSFPPSFSLPINNMSEGGGEEEEEPRRKGEGRNLRIIIMIIIVKVRVIIAPLIYFYLGVEALKCLSRDIPGKLNSKFEIINVGALPPFIHILLPFCIPAVFLCEGAHK
jgi:hypothetical protein